MSNHPAKRKYNLVSRSSSRERFARLYTTLRNRICLLDYPPGLRLREDALAEEFGVSRTPLRRVLGHLENEGLVKSVQSVGTFVTDLEFESLAQVYELRLELALLIGRLSPCEDIEAVAQKVQGVICRCSNLPPDISPRDFAQLNMDFFNAVLDLTENEPLREFAERLYYRTTRIWLSSLSQENLNEERSAFLQEATEILSALETGDLSAAAHLRRAHLTMSFIRLQKRHQSGHTGHSAHRNE